MIDFQVRIRATWQLPLQAALRSVSVTHRSARRRSDAWPVRPQIFPSCFEKASVLATIDRADLPSLPAHGLRCGDRPTAQLLPGCPGIDAATAHDALPPRRPAHMRRTGRGVSTAHCHFTRCIDRVMRHRRRARPSARLLHVSTGTDSPKGKECQVRESQRNLDQFMQTTAAGHHRRIVVAHRVIACGVAPAYQPERMT